MSAGAAALASVDAARVKLVSGGHGEVCSDNALERLIDRKALVGRHNPILLNLDPFSPLSLGNGEFAFTADITGLQTFSSEYEKTMPLCTMSQWGWHTRPLPPGIDPNNFRLTQYETYGRLVGYATSSEGQRELYDWLRENPHRLHLGRIGLRLLANDKREAAVSDIGQIDQRVDLWTGMLTSRFRFRDWPVIVQTAVHPDLDLLAVRIESPLISERLLGVRFAFPYSSPEMNAADWTKPERHRSEVIAHTKSAVSIQRKFETDEYYTTIEWTGEASFTLENPHEFLLQPVGSQHTLEFVVKFSAHREWSASDWSASVPLAPNISESKRSKRGRLRSSQLRTSQRRYRLPNAADTFAASSRHWQRFWSEGAAIDLSGSRHPRAAELERRIVLSQYLTAIQCSGSLPPQETGLTVNSWYGKFHLEMHWWHAAHFALWNRLPLLEKSLSWYASILSRARELAKSQGYRGARWPKMVGPEGRDSPSPVGPLLIWQQPHPIFYAELCYLSHPHLTTLARYRDIVFESAEFMASYAYFENVRNRFVLGPPVIPAQENHPARETWNPTFELAYWSWGLGVAQRWRARLGMQRSAEWERVIRQLSSLPTRDGVYLAHENCPQTFTERNYDHPSMLGAFGMLPGRNVDRETMRRTLKRVRRDWQWDKTWGWDYPLTAMTAARLGETQVVIDVLLMNTEKNRYLANGHNWQRANLPCYLPGNGGLLYAMAILAGGWSGAPAGNAPGFPDDGAWKVRVEGLNATVLQAI